MSDPLTLIQICHPPVPLVNEADNEGNTAVHYLAKGGNVEVFEVLLEHGADIARCVAPGPVYFFTNVWPLLLVHAFTQVTPLFRYS